MAKNAKVVEQAPAYKTGTIYGADDPVYVERFCSCGGILRVRGRFADAMSFLGRWEAGHSGEGHESVDKLTAARARSEAHERGFNEGIEKGDIPADQKFEPIDWDSKNLGVTNEEVYAQ